MSTRDPLEPLLDQIEADPGDVTPQLVLADHLAAAGDPRGELILLDHLDRTTPGGLVEVAALERLLELAAEYGFPSLAPALPRLDWRGGGEYPVRYEVAHGGHAYSIVYYRHELRVEIDEGAIESGTDDGIDLPARLHGKWSDEEADVILSILSDVIRAGTPFENLVFPYGDSLPTYDGGPRRCYATPREYTEPRGWAPHRFGLAARDYHRWHALFARLPVR